MEENNMEHQKIGDRLIIINGLMTKLAEDISKTSAIPDEDKRNEYEVLLDELISHLDDGDFASAWSTWVQLERHQEPVFNKMFISNKEVD
jgi:hypothetical protein